MQHYVDSIGIENCLCWDYSKPKHNVLLCNTGCHIYFVELRPQHEKFLDQKNVLQTLLQHNQIINKFKYVSELKATNLFTSHLMGVNVKSKLKYEFGALSNSQTFLAILVTVTVLGFIEPIVNAFREKDYWVLVVYVIVIMGVIYWARISNKRLKNKANPLKRKVFHPFDILDKTTAWPRIEEENSLIDMINSSVCKPTLIVGESGVGKSVIVSSYIIPYYASIGWDTIHINEYNGIKYHIKKELNEFDKKCMIDEKGNVVNAGIKNNLLIVFDQFEQFLSRYSKTTIDDTQNRDWFHHFIKSIEPNEKIRVLIIIRKEWYYDLRFLSEFIPPPISCFNLTGLKNDKNNSGIEELTRRLEDVTKDDKTAELIVNSLSINNEISPVEAQLVGCMLENKIDEIGVITKEKFLNIMGGKDGLIEEFFEINLRASQNKELALQILFALSIEIKYRRQLTLAQLIGIIHKPQNEILSCVNFLMDQKLITEVSLNHYQLSHDYLAEKFHEISGTELEPKERDNILYFGDELRRERESHITILEETPPKFKVVSDYYLAVLITIITIRLFIPLLDFKFFDVFNPIRNFVRMSDVFDIYYFPIFVSHLAWSIYVNIFYRRFFSLLKESNGGKFLSGLTLVTCFIAVATALFIPNCWILSIGFGGLFVGIKLTQLGHIKNLSKISKKEFKEMGWQTIWNSSIAIFLGIFFTFLFFYKNNLQDLKDTYLWVSFPAAAILTYACYVVGGKHIMPNSTAAWLGIFDRRQYR